MKPEIKNENARMKSRILSTAVTSLFLGTAISHATPVFTDTFDSGTGSWYKAGTMGILNNDGTGRLRWNQGDGSNMDEVIGRSFTPQTLNVGQTLRLTFEFSWNTGSTTTGSSQIIRAGLFNVTSPITADNWAGANAIGAWDGYYTFVRDGNATGNLARRESSATASATNGPTNGTGTVTPIGSDFTNFNINDDATVTYHGSFEVSRVSDDRIDTLFILKEGAVTRFSVSGSQTSESIVTAFNTVVFKTGAFGPVAFFDHVQVETISASDGFSSWIAGSFANGSVPPGQQGPNDDPDHDGIANLLEFVLNGDPTLPNPGILPTLDASGADLVFTYQRRDDSLAPETVQTFQYGSDLVGWSDVIVPATNATVGAATVIVTDGSPADTVQISIPKSEAVEGRFLGRLKVEN